MTRRGRRACERAAEARGINFRYPAAGRRPDFAERDGHRDGPGRHRRGVRARPAARRRRAGRGRRGERRCRTPLRAHVGVPDAPGVQRASFRDRDDALHPQPRAQGHRPRHGDDSARLLHDEAERGGRDDAGELAGVLAPAPVRAGRSDGGLSARCFASSRPALAERSRVCRPCRCSRTPARRASSRACS